MKILCSECSTVTTHLRIESELLQCDSCGNHRQLDNVIKLDEKTIDGYAIYSDRDIEKRLVNAEIIIFAMANFIIENDLGALSFPEDILEKFVISNVDLGSSLRNRITAEACKWATRDEDEQKS